MPASPSPKRRKGLKADYRGATPEQVAGAVGRYRPKPTRSGSRASNGNR